MIYPILLVLTAWKDFYYTGEEPNILFYASVPEVGILSSSLFLFLFTKLLRRSLAFVPILKIVFITEFIFQVWENVSKIVYYELWKYPGLLWFLVFPLNIALIAWLFKRVCHTAWSYGILLAFTASVSGMIFGLIFASVTGISTPGS